MTSIRKLFKKRENTYTEHTQSLLLAMKGVVAGIHEVIGDQSEYISWKVVEYMEDDDYLMLAGVIMLPEGYVVNSGGKQLVLTEENRAHFTRFLRVGLPMDLVEEGSKTKVVDYLREHAEGEFNELNSESSDFSLDELTPEQKQQLEMFSDTSRRGRPN